MPELSPVYTDMREELLAVSPDTTQMKPTDKLPHVYGALIDIGFEVLFTVATFADGSTSVYNSNGGGNAGLGGLPDVVAMNGALLRTIESQLNEFKPVESTPLPAFGRVRFTILTYDGRLGAEVDGGSLLRGKHSLAKPFAAVMAIMDRARQSTPQSN
jgi:hypothetical protein